MPGIHVTFRSQGSCVGSNVDLGNAQAYRCFLTKHEPDGANVEDPCFVDPLGTAQPLLCLSSPDGKKAVAVENTGDLTPNEVQADADPWFIQLADGQLCGSIGGATYSLNGKRAAFGCDQGGTLFGSLNKSAAVWTILYQAKGAASVIETAVRRTWN